MLYGTKHLKNSLLMLIINLLNYFKEKHKTTIRNMLSKYKKVYIIKTNNWGIHKYCNTKQNKIFNTRIDLYYYNFPHCAQSRIKRCAGRDTVIVACGWNA